MVTPRPHVQQPQSNANLRTNKKERRNGKYLDGKAERERAGNAQNRTRNRGQYDGDGFGRAAMTPVLHEPGADETEPHGDESDEARG